MGDDRLLSPDGGWLRVPRNLLDPQHPLHPASAGERACTLGAVIDLLGLCRWRERDGLERGECRASERFLAQRWGWERSEVRGLLRELQRAGEIEREPGTGRKPGRIRFVHYDDLQARPSAHESPRKSAHKRPDTTGESSGSSPTHLPTNPPKEKEESTDAGQGESDYARGEGEPASKLCSDCGEVEVPRQRDRCSRCKRLESVDDAFGEDR